LKHIFQAIDRTLPESGKHFKEFYLNNPAITELKENTFSQIIFDKINIYNSTKFKLINTYAFNATNLLTKHFQINEFRNPKISTPIVNSPPDHDLFQIQCSFAIVDSLMQGQIVRYNESSLYRVDFLRFLSYTPLQVVKNENYLLNAC